MTPERCLQPWVNRQNFQIDPTATTPQASRNHEGLGIQREACMIRVLKSADAAVGDRYPRRTDVRALHLPVEQEDSTLSATVHNGHNMIPAWIHDPVRAQGRH